MSEIQARLIPHGRYVTRHTFPAVSTQPALALPQEEMKRLNGALTKRTTHRSDRYNGVRVNNFK